VSGLIYSLKSKKKPKQLKTFFPKKTTFFSPVLIKYMFFGYFFLMLVESVRLSWVTLKAT